MSFCWNRNWFKLQLATWLTMVEESMATLDSFLQRQDTLHFLKVALDSFDQFDLEITWQMQPWKLVLKHMLKSSTLSNWNNTWEIGYWSSMETASAPTPTAHNSGDAAKKPCNSECTHCGKYKHKGSNSKCWELKVNKDALKGGSVSGSRKSKIDGAH